MRLDCSAETGQYLRCSLVGGRGSCKNRQGLAGAPARGRAPGRHSLADSSCERKRSLPANALLGSAFQPSISLGSYSPGRGVGGGRQARGLKREGLVCCFWAQQHALLLRARRCRGHGACRWLRPVAALPVATAQRSCWLQQQQRVVLSWRRWLWRRPPRVQALPRALPLPPPPLPARPPPRTRAWNVLL